MVKLSQKNVLNAEFREISMIELDYREVISTKEFGVEHCLRFLFKKKLLNK